MGNKTRGLILGMLGQLQRNITFEDCRRNKTFYDGVKHGIKLARKAIEGMKLETPSAMTWRNVKKDGLPPDTEPWKEYNVCVLRQHWPTSSFDVYDAPCSEEIVTTARFDARQKIWHLSWAEQLNALIDPEDLSHENSDCVTDWIPLPKKPGGK